MRLAAAIVLMLAAGAAPQPPWNDNPDRTAFEAGFRGFLEAGKPDSLDPVVAAMRNDLLSDDDYNRFPDFFNKHYGDAAFTTALDAAKASGNVVSVAIVAGGLTGRLKGYHESKMGRDRSDSIKPVAEMLATADAPRMDRLVTSVVSMLAQTPDGQETLLTAAVNPTSAYAAQAVATLLQTSGDRHPSALLAKWDALNPHAQQVLALDRLQKDVYESKLTDADRERYFACLLDAVRLDPKLTDAPEARYWWWTDHHERSPEKWAVTVMAALWTGGLYDGPRVEGAKTKRRAATQSGAAAARRQLRDAIGVGLPRLLARDSAPSRVELWSRGTAGHRGATAADHTLLAQALRMRPDVLSWALKVDDSTSLHQAGEFCIKSGVPEAHAAFRQRVAELAADGTTSASLLGPLAWQLAQTGHADDLAVVRPMIDHKNPEVGMVAVRAIGSRPTPEALALCETLAFSAEPTIAEAAIEGLRRSVATPLTVYARLLMHRHNTPAFRAGTALAEITGIPVANQQVLSGFDFKQDAARAEYRAYVDLLKAEGWLPKGFSLDAK
jgi:hypothetical protein